MLNYHSLFKSACNSTYRLFVGTLKIIKFRKNNLKFSQIVVVKSCSQGGATYGICCMVAETISVICSEQSYRHGAPDLALMSCTCL